MSRFVSLLRGATTLSAVRPNLYWGTTWNRVMALIADGDKTKKPAIFANSVFSHLDISSTARLMKLFMPPQDAKRDFILSDDEITKILNGELKKEGEKEPQMRKLLEANAASCLRFFDSKKYEGVLDKSQKEIAELEEIRQAEEKLGAKSWQKMRSSYGLVAGEDETRKQLAQIWNEKNPEKLIDPEEIIITHS